MKKGILIVNYELIRVYTMLHIILGIQKGRKLWDGNGRRSFAKLGRLVWNLIPGFEFIKVGLRSEGVTGSEGRWKETQNHRSPYFEAVDLGWWNKRTVP
jgi:hypothetical protein